MTGSKDYVVKDRWKKEPFFVQGFEMLDDNTILQSAGLYSASELQIVDINHKTKETKVFQRTTLDSKYFGEGCTALGDSIYMLTYRERKALKFNKKTLAKIAELDLP